MIEKGDTEHTGHKGEEEEFGHNIESRGWAVRERRPHPMKPSAQTCSRKALPFSASNILPLCPQSISHSTLTL